MAVNMFNHISIIDHIGNNFVPKCIRRIPAWMTYMIEREIRSKRKLWPLFKSNGDLDILDRFK